MKNKILVPLIFVCIVATLILNSIYGPLVYSKIIGKEKAYEIGQACYSDRALCEKTYFQSYLDKIDSIYNKPRTYFSDIVIENDQIGYSGNCPCPYNTDVRGYSCGGRSSYSKSGQISYCYDNDVSDTKVASMRSSLTEDAHRDLNNVVQQNLSVYHEKYTFFLILFFYGGLLVYLKAKNKKVK